MGKIELGQTPRDPCNFVTKALAKIKLGTLGEGGPGSRSAVAGGEICSGETEAHKTKMVMDVTL